MQDLALFFATSLAAHLALFGLWQLARGRMSPRRAGKTS